MRRVYTSPEQLARLPVKSKVYAICRDEPWPDYIDGCDRWEKAWDDRFDWDAPRWARRYHSGKENESALITDKQLFEDNRIIFVTEGE